MSSVDVISEISKEYNTSYLIFDEFINSRNKPLTEEQKNVIGNAINDISKINHILQLIESKSIKNTLSELDECISLFSGLLKSVFYCSEFVIAQAEELKFVIIKSYDLNKFLDESNKLKNIIDKNKMLTSEFNQPYKVTYNKTEKIFLVTEKMNSELINKFIKNKLSGLNEYVNRTLNTTRESLISVKKFIEKHKSVETELKEFIKDTKDPFMAFFVKYGPTEGIKALSPENKGNQVLQDKNKIIISIKNILQLLNNFDVKSFVNDHLTNVSDIDKTLNKINTLKDALLTTFSIYYELYNNVNLLRPAMENFSKDNLLIQRGYSKKEMDAKKEKLFSAITEIANKKQKGTEKPDFYETLTGGNVKEKINIIEREEENKKKVLSQNKLFNLFSKKEDSFEEIIREKIDEKKRNDKEFNDSFNERMKRMKKALKIDK